MESQGQGENPTSPQGGGASPSASGTATALDPTVVLSQLATAVAQLASVNQPKPNTWSESKYVKAPEIFAPKSLDEELSQWSEWSFTFKQWMYIQEEEYRNEFQKCETADSFVSFESYAPETKARSIRLYAILATYLRQRPLRILRSVENGDGYRVWRTLSDELQPQSRPRALALAQALVRFPAYKEGGSLLDYTLAFERLVQEYDKVAAAPYDDNLKISTLLSGLPGDVKKYLQLNLDETMTYEKMRTQLLRFERSTALWSSEHLLRSVGIEKDAKYLESGGPTPMDVDRVEQGKDRNNKGEKGRKGKDKGKGKYHYQQHGNKGWGSYGDKGSGKQWGKNNKGKDKSGKNGKKGKDKDKGKGKLGPCYTCGRMGHIAADCRAGVRQVQESESSTSVPSSSASTASSNASTTSSARTIPQVRRLELHTMPVIEEIEAESEFLIYTPPSAPTCQYYDLSGQDSENENFSEIRMVTLESEALEETEPELASTSTLMFDIHSPRSSDGEDCGHVRVVREQMVGYQEVILDSGADVTVLPMSMSEAGEESGSVANIRDAQGNTIASSSTRRNVIFEMEGLDGKKIYFKDRAVIGNVRQPLMCVGKLFQNDWSVQRDSSGSHVMARGNQGFAVHWARNSLATRCKIYRIESGDDASSNVRMIVEIPENLERLSATPGWKLRRDGQPMHVSMSSDCTVNPGRSYPSHIWPFRSTLVHKGERKYEVFESGEIWEGREVLQTYGPKVKMITLLSQNPVDPETLGAVQSELARPQVRGQAREAEAPEEAREERCERPMEVEVGASQALGLAESGPPDGPEERAEHPAEADVLPRETGEEKLVINGIEVFETSSLRTLRAACQYMRISKSGGKGVLWARLQAEIADSRIKAAVQASDAMLTEYARQPQVEPQAALPDQATIDLHEITHFPRASWCSACLSSRSREDNRPGAETKERGVIHVDFMFGRTETPGSDEEHAMSTHMVVVDEQTNFCLCVPVESKAAHDLKNATEEVVKLGAVLGHSELVIRGDSEPAMIQFLKTVSASRSRLGLGTKIEVAPPDSQLHHGLKAERFITIVRSMGKCLLASIEEKTGWKVTSNHPLFYWAFRHGAFLYSRFHVLRCGQTPFELLHGRAYAGKLCPFGATVFAQILPKTNAKAEPWRRCVWLGKSSMGNLNLVADQHGVHYARSVRRGSTTYVTENLVSMKGVPWNSVLDVVPTKPKRAPRIRVPDVLLPQAPQDEAASDPPSSVAGEPAGGIGGGITPEGGSVMSTDSPEMLPDAEMENASQVVELEGYMLRRVVGTSHPTNHEDEIEIEGLEVDLPIESMEQDYEKGLEGQSVEDHEELPWKGRTYEEGPPQLSQQELEELDRRMDDVEYTRLEKMGVLRPMQREEDGKGMVCLKSKTVRDWRFRGEWRRRSRLVAKEFRHLQPALEDLYAPASLGILQKLLAGLCVSGENLVMYMVDVSDAYLMVPQRRPTFITTSTGLSYELKYNLPGQRSGARDWFMYAGEIFAKDGLTSYPAAPAVYYEPKSLACSTHVDDFQFVSGEKRASKLLGNLKKSGLKLKIEGPIDPFGGQGHFLKRLFQGKDGSIRVIPEKRYVEKLISILQLERSASKSTPLPSTIRYPQEDPPLEGSAYSTFRSALGLLLYMANDIPEIHFAMRLLGSRCASPSEYDLAIMRHVGKYMKGRPEWVLQLKLTRPGRTLEQRLRECDTECTRDPVSERGSFSRCEHDVEHEHEGECSFGTGHVLEVITDSDWGSRMFGRKSVSSYSLYLNGNMVFVSTRLQKSYALSSTEAEWMSSLLGVADGIFVKQFLETFLESEVKLVHRVDNSGARALAAREGAGKLRHIDLSYLWLQKENRSGHVLTRPISTYACPSDLGTKPHSKKRILFLLGLMGYVDNETGILAGGKEVKEYLVSAAIKQGQQNNILRVLLASYLAPVAMGSGIGEQSENNATIVLFVISIFIVMIIGGFCAATLGSRVQQLKFVKISVG